MPIGVVPLKFLKKNTGVNSRKPEAKYGSLHSVGPTLHGMTVKKPLVKKLRFGRV
jgi:hypothetical protein